MEIIDGKITAKEIKNEIAHEVESLCRSRGKKPHLAAVLVGHDGGSETYVAYKIKDCEEVGFHSSLIRFEDDVSEEALLDKIDELNIITGYFFTVLVIGYMIWWWLTNDLQWIVKLPAGLYQQMLVFHAVYLCY